MATTVWTGYRSASKIWYSKVVGEPTDRSTSVYKYQEVEKGRALAIRLKAEHVITREDGSIESKNSYGHDPANIPG